MKKHTLLAVLLMLSVSSSFAQASWTWARGEGGTQNDEAIAVTSTAAGDVYVAGFYLSSTMTIGATTLTNAGANDIFLARYDDSGSPIWAKSIGGSNNDNPTSLTCDAGGNLYMTGYFKSTSLTFGTYTLTNTGNNDMFLVKYDLNGNVLWATSATGAGDEIGYSVTADAGGHIYVGGYYGSSPSHFDTTSLSMVGGGDMFIAKYDASNGHEIWARGAGGTGQDQTNSVCTDASGNVYLAGMFTSPTITFGATPMLSKVLGAGNDLFIVKYDANGTALWAKSAGGSSNDEATSITISAGGDLFVGGYFASSILQFDTTVLHNTGYNNMFLNKYTTSGVLQWTRDAGGKLGDVGGYVTTDGSGNAYIAGTMGSDTILFGPDLMVNSGINDMVVMKFSSNGTPVWGRRAGGAGDDDANSIHADASGNIYCAGNYASANIAFGSNNLTDGTPYFNFYLARLGNTTGIEEEESGGNLTVFPDPATDMLQVRGLGENALLLLSDLSGRALLRTPASGQASLSLEALPSGVYLLTCKNADGRGSAVVKKIIHL